MERFSGAFILLLATISWSSAGLFVRILETDLPTTLFWRSFFGGLSMLVFYLVMKRNLNLRQAFTFSKGEFIISMLCAVGMLCFISAFFFTTIANVTFAYGIVPLVTYGLAIIFLKDRLRLSSLFCCGMAVMGMLIMVAGNVGLDNFIGIGLSLAMTLAVAGMTIAGKFFSSASAGKATYLASFIAALVMLPFASLFEVSQIDFAWLVLYGTVNVSLGFGLYLFGVKKCAALTASLITLCEIPMAPAWAWLLFQERIGFGTFIGGFFITSAVLIYVFLSAKRKEL